MFQLNSLDSVRDAIPRDAMISLIWVIYYEILNLMSSSWRFVTLSRARVRWKPRMYARASARYNENAESGGTIEDRERKQKRKGQAVETRRHTAFSKCAGDWPEERQ